MSKSLNKVTLLGNVGNDIELKQTNSGKAVVELRIATSESYKDKEGNKVEKTEWHSVVFFDKTADVIGKYVKKGSKLYVEGQIRTRSYEKDGTTFYKTEVVGRELLLLDGKPAESEGKPAAKPAKAPAKPAAKPAPAPAEDFEDDDIPF